MSACSANNTLTRPMSTMSTDNNNLTRTLPKGVDFHRNLNNGIGSAMQPLLRRVIILKYTF